MIENTSGTDESDLPQIAADGDRLALMAERDRLAGIVERVKTLADEVTYYAPFGDGDRDCVLVDDLLAAIEGDGGELA